MELTTIKNIREVRDEIREKIKSVDYNSKKNGQLWKRKRIQF